MRTQPARSVSVQTEGLTLKLTQVANGKARGALHLSDPKNKVEFRLMEAGWLQSHGKWASFTARVRVMPEAVEQTALVLLDGGNPHNSTATVRVELEGGRQWEGRLKPSEYKINVRK